MKTFLSKNVLALPNPQIIHLLQEIELRKGGTFSLPHLKNINRLHNLSKRRNTASSNAIEGIRVTPKRETDLLSLGLKPEVYEDFMMIGYNAALERIISSYSYQDLDERFVLDLHQLMYKGYNTGFGGKWKDTQNYIVQDSGKDKTTVLFTPSKPEDVPQLMGNLIWQYNACFRDPEVNRLLLIPVFILDFLCVHPFNDGNGRMSRLLTSFLLLKDDYDIDLYYSLSYLILARQEEYYQALHNSDHGWEKDENDYAYFATYLLQIILEGYDKLDKMVEFASWKATAEKKAVKAINESPVPLSKADLEELLFSLSRTTIEKALGDSLKAGKIRMIQSGHYAKYYRK